MRWKLGKENNDFLSHFVVKLPFSGLDLQLHFQCQHEDQPKKIVTMKKLDKEYVHLSRASLMRDLWRENTAEIFGKNE